MKTKYLSNILIEWRFIYLFFLLIMEEKITFNMRNTLHPSYSERVGAAKIVHNNRVFTINIINFTIN